MIYLDTFNLRIYIIINLIIPFYLINNYTLYSKKVDYKEKIFKLNYIKPIILIKISLSIYNKIS
jgi:hypothetical protein